MRLGQHLNVPRNLSWLRPPVSYEFNELQPNRRTSQFVLDTSDKN